MSETEKNRDLAWEEVKTEHIVQDQWIDFRRCAYRFLQNKHGRHRGAHPRQTDC